MSRPRTIKVGVTGGIGSGKSTVCRLFAVLGAPVYDSDARARELMEGDVSLAEQIAGVFGPEAYPEGKPDRAFLAAKVFGDKAALATLNSLVHPAVIRDFIRWAEEQEHPYVVMESAIIFEAGLAGHLDYTVTVSAPQEQRIERAMARDNACRMKVEARIANQMDDGRREELADYVIRNEEQDVLWPQVVELDAVFRRAAEPNAAETKL